MTISRREFVILSTAMIAGCAVAGDAVKQPAAAAPAAVDIGSSADYAADGVYSRFRDRGFFVVRRGEHLLAVSSTCTHEACRVDAESDRSFYCPCHGSTFDPTGKVKQGPATKDLPAYAIAQDRRGHLIVTVAG